MSGTVTTFSQDDRFLSIDCPLPRNDLVLTQLSGVDPVSAPFSFYATICTVAEDKAVRDLLGKPATLHMSDRFGGLGAQPIHGIIQQIAGPERPERGVTIWHLVVVPKLALLSLTSDCKIFQDMAIPDIVKNVLDAHGVTYKASLTGDYPKLDYCVQYRETALNFISRLMESVGIFYWHEHTDSSHTMVIVDSNHTAQQALSGTVITEQDSSDPDVTGIHENYAFRSGKWALTDYDFTAPSSDLMGSTPTTEKTAGLTDYEMYDYPGPFPLSGDSLKHDGSKQTRLRIENEEANFHRLTGTGNRPSIRAGRYLKFAADTLAQDDQKLFLTEVTISAVQDAQLGGLSNTATFSSHFTCMPFSKPFRPDRVAIKPFVRGLQTAVVTGPAGEKIYTDKHGRVKVQFFWDRKGKKDDKSSCWIRVSQVWADKNFGAIHIPRIGQEVIVDFLEGDPDKPIITGRVYNGDNTPPYGLPGNKTQSGFKSYSVPGSGFNEFRFEDKGGSEQIYLHAQKDLDSDILANETRNVGGNRTTKIKGIDDRTVTGDTKDTLNSSYIRKVATGVTDTISAGGETRTVTGGISETITGAVSQTITGNYTQTVTGAISQTATTTIGLTAPAGITLTSASSVTINQPEQWQTGVKCMAAYITNIGVYVNNLQTALNNYGAYASQVQVVGVNVQGNGMSTTNSIAQFDNAAIKNEDAPTKIEIHAVFLIL